MKDSEYDNHPLVLERISETGRYCAKLHLQLMAEAATLEPGSTQRTKLLGEARGFIKSAREADKGEETRLIAEMAKQVERREKAREARSSAKSDAG